MSLSPGSGSGNRRLGARFDRFVTAIKTTVFESAGDTPPELRRAIAAGQTQAIPDVLRPYIEKVTRHAYKVTDDDVAALKRAGYSEDQIFEVTTAAALGAALARLERGIAVLQERAP